MSETKTVPAGTYISSISQADADNQALAWLDFYAFYSNASGTCTYSYPNNEKIVYFTKNDCTAIGAKGSRDS